MTEAKRKKNEGYKNYKLSRNSIEPNSIDVIDLNNEKVTKNWFYENYIKVRKPAVIKFTEENDLFSIDLSSFKPENISETLKADDDDVDELLQVEEINNGGFGSGKKRLKMSFDNFLDRVNKGDTLYLTTQYEENDPSIIEEENEDDEEEEEEDESGFKIPTNGEDVSDNDSLIMDPEDMHDDFDEEVYNDIGSDLGECSEPLNLIYQAPLSNLLNNGNINKLPPHAIPLTEPLIPQQINLWMGRTPSNTLKLETKVDDNNRIKHVNRGLPSENSTSTGLHHDHADNLYVLIQGKKRFTLFSPDFANDLYTTGDVRHIYDTGIIDYVKNEKAPNWESIRADGGCLGNSDDCSNKNKDMINDEKLDPPSFCKIPPALLHLDEVKDIGKRELLRRYLAENFPSYEKIKQSGIKVELNDGDLLYLPSGWFHEVTSYGDLNNNNIHIAINYWFVPPDNNQSIENLYTDDEWAKDYELWKQKYFES